MVPGDLTVAARISNQAICSLSIRYVASFISCPLGMMIPFGVDFLRLAPLTVAQVHDL